MTPGHAGAATRPADGDLRLLDRDKGTGSRPATPRASVRDHAVELATMGFSVFKLREGEKTPAVDRWPEAATSDPKAAHAMWTSADGSEIYNNIGMAMGWGFVALDVDVKGGKPGLASLKALEEKGLNTNTLTCMTPSGGRHLFYRIPMAMQLRNGVDLLGEGIDVRGFRGYVVGAGSSLHPVNGRKQEYYLLHRTTPILEAPEWLLDMIGEGKPRQPTAVPLVELDLTENIERAREYLIERAPEAIQGHGGERDTYLVAAHCIDYGLSEGETLSAMLTWWNDYKAHPRWSPSELQLKVENAWKYRKLPVGIRAYVDPRDEFEPIDVKGQIAPQSGAILTPKSRLFWRGYDESADRALLASQDPLVKRLLTAGAMSVLYGDSNTGKTFAALSLAHHIATGTPWYNKKVTQGTVVYVAAEAGESINARLAALRSHYAPSPPPPLAVVPCLVDLFAAGAALKPLIAMIKEIGTHYGAPVRFVVIDTLARAMAGGDENSTKDMGTFVGNVDRIRVETGAHVMIVHHTGKDQSRGARGSSALRAATDTELSLAKDSESREGLLTVAKQRDGETGLKIGFALSVVDLGKDTDGDPVTSCVALFSDAQQEFEAVDSAGEWLAEIKVYEAARAGAHKEELDDRPGGPGCEWGTGELGEFVARRDIATKRADPRKSGAAKMAVKRLLEKDKIQKRAHGIYSRVIEVKIAEESEVTESHQKSP